jgi:hypothetical protein
MTIMADSGINTRAQLGGLLNVRNLTGQAVEVGTHRGKFAHDFLHHWPGKLLYCIDPWDNPPGYEQQGEILRADLGGGASREEDYRAALRLLEVHKNRFKPVRALSSEAAQQFKDGQLDFAYIDGNHERAYVEEDLRLWWPKVKAGGMLAGHDFICPCAPDGGWGQHIQPAVLEHCARHGVDVHLVVEENGMPWSWYAWKPR